MLLANLHKLYILFLSPPSFIYFILYVSMLCLINRSILPLFNRSGRATRGHSGPEVTSGHTFLGSVIISQPEAQGLHKKWDRSSQSPVVLAELSPALVLNVFSDPQQTASIKHYAMSLGSQESVMLFFSSMNISRTTGAWRCMKASM